MDIKNKTALEIMKEKTAGELDRVSMRNENWVDMDETYPGYAVSDQGRVFSYKTGALIRQHPNSSGYLRVHLHIDNADRFPFVHRLVALHFCPNPCSKPHVNHIDGQKKRNVAANLEWCTPSENINHSFRQLRQHRTLNQIDPETNKVVDKYDYIVDAADTLKLSSSRISTAIKYNKPYSGYLWQYA